MASHESTSSPAVKQWAGIVLIVLFGVSAWLPTMDLFFHFDHTPAFNEKRVPAPFPQFKSGVQNVREYFMGLEAFFNDHFGCRRKLIFWHIELTNRLFHDSGVPSVLIGKDGWLYWADTQMVEHYRGVNQFTVEDLKNWKTLLERRRDWLARQGIQYIFVVGPDKDSVYPEYLPDWLTKVRPQTKLEQFFDYMHSNSTVNVLDLRPALFTAKKTGPVYFKHDAHWNTWGGYVAAEEIIKTLAPQMPALKPLPLDSFDFQVTNRPGGDLAVFLGLNDLVDDQVVSLQPKSSLPVLKTSKLGETMYEMFITTNSTAQVNAMVFHDSFAYSLNPFLGYHFHIVTYIWDYKLDQRWIGITKPGVVINEMVERNFNIWNPKDLMAGEVLK